jgi:TPR repeat protein
MAACFELGRLYLDGNGVVKDASKAKALIQRACDGGEPKACDLARALPGVALRPPSPLQRDRRPRVAQRPVRA